jgi:hypothetical protein
MSNGLSERKPPGIKKKRTTYTNRTRLVEAALKKLKSKGIPSPEIIQTTIESFTIDSVQKSVESASKRASLEQSPFPNASADIWDLDLWKSGWTVVADSSESEQDTEPEPAPSTSQERERSRSPRARRTVEEIFSEPVTPLGF